MKSALLAIGFAALVRGQGIAVTAVQAAPPMKTETVSAGNTPTTSSYISSAAEASVASDISNDPVTVATSTVSGFATVVKRDGSCATQPTGAGPSVTPDTASAFLANPAFSSAAVNAPVPSGYVQTFSNLDASNSANGYLGYTTLDSYDPASCAAQCSSIAGCSAINIFFERDPTLDPGSDCSNPPSTTVIKCVFWGSPVTPENANNQGQYRANFQVVIAGSNGYVSTQYPAVAGYTGPAYLGDAAINAPNDCNGANTYMGVTVFSSGIFDPSLCAAACSAQSAYNIAHPPATGDPMTCQFFNTYMLMDNGQAVGQFCAMYNETWAASYATNTGMTYNGDQYTIMDSVIYSNATDTGEPQCEACAS